MQELYMKYKGLLFKLAYQLTGSVSDAEDVVQDVFVKIYDVPPEKLSEPKAYLCKMVTNRCRDLHKAARKKREEYYGEWLPEPFLSLEEDSMESVVTDDLLSYGMLVLLERLSVSERIVFVLREALGFEYQEIAELIEKSEVNCRKLFSRATAKMGISSEETNAVHPEPANQEWIHGFLAALKQGNMNQILSMLDNDVVMISDGGGKVQAALKPTKSRKIVARALLGPIRQAAVLNGEVVVGTLRVNGQPAIVIRSSDGYHTVGILQVEGDAIRNIYLVRNPEKLRNVGSYLSEV
jgi:RNA polymerase sigma-70 factor (ECF subfamily)